MEILFVHLGTPCECFISTSVLKGLYNKYGPAHIYCLVKNRETAQIFKYNKKIKSVYEIDKVPNEILKKSFDMVINLHPDFFAEYAEKIKALDAKIKLGFSSENDSGYFDILYGNKESSKSIFQIYFYLAGLRWQGEGFDVSYRPKSKTKKKVSGISIANANLRKYIIEKLKLDNSKLWNIPYRQNLFSRMDEVNKCPYIVTDDFFTLNIALALRKQVCFLRTIPFNTKLEFFGNGSVFDVPKSIIQ